MDENERHPGIIIVGLFFLLVGLIFILSNLGLLGAMRDSVLLALIFIVTGYFVVRLKEFGRKLTILLSIFNIILIAKFILLLAISRPVYLPGLYGICQMLAGSIWSACGALVLFALIVYLFTRAEVKGQFIDEGYGGPRVPLDKNKEAPARPKALEAEVARLYKIISAKNDLIEDYRVRLTPPTLKEEVAGIDGASADEIRGQKSKRIGEILLEQNLITREVLEEALEQQKQYGGSTTQYLLYHGFIDEKQLAQCLCAQFGVPYLPVASYDISDEIIRLIPVDIAEKYWLIPVDKQGDSLMIVMIDPLDIKVIKQLEDLTGLKIKPFVGIISEIATALQVYYKVLVKDDKAHTKVPPFFVDTKVYKGIERRQSIRYDTKIYVKYPVQGKYNESQTINVSRDGFAFKSETPLTLSSVVPLEINLPLKYSALPISAIVQVVRCVPLKDKSFEIGVRTLKISKQELGTIIDYATSHDEE